MCRMIKLSTALSVALVLCCLGCWQAVYARVANTPASRKGFLARLHCPQCNPMTGVGTTFFTSHWTDGIVLPLILEIDQSRWEIAALRFSSDQYLKESFAPPSTVSARPYWGFSVLRRWQVLHRSRWKLYLGIGGSYQTQRNLLDSTRWNFAYLFAVRYALSRHKFLELSVRHWSNAWIKLPNRGQDIVLLGIGFG